ncbi:hypothetical protein H4219_001577 [Mycoemilia scoparia]|uniref:CDT1 Geminin-binding domain-containing protein n=1 Tax=Mycoemilia scoparia TaxID=417184 RepID=A0A9W8DRP2_9FUNG|nr:hypothetical protein H4219_001577 [Mycoemilia scoparia]
MNQVQRTPRTLKNYLHVSKSSASQAAKDAFSPVKRVTRSQARKAQTHDVVEETIETTLAVAELPTTPKARKRKQTSKEDIATSKKKKYSPVDETSNGLAKYFKVDKSQVLSPRTIRQTRRTRKAQQTKKQPQENTLVMSISASTQTNTTEAQSTKSEIVSAKQIPSTPLSDYEPANPDLKPRAEELLRKLRNRKVPASLQRPSVEGERPEASPTVLAPQSKQAETTEIQESIKLRRLGLNLPTQDIKPSSKSFDHNSGQSAPPVVFNTSTQQHTDAINNYLTPTDIRPKFELIRRRAFDLPLPERLAKLEAIFQAIEHTLMFTQGQGHTCIYHRHRKSVENSSGHTFTLRHLAQIKYVYPESYTFKPTKVLIQGRNIDSIEINVFKKANSEEASGSKGPTQSIALKNARFAADSLEKRRQEMRERLVKYVDKYHVDFLEKQKMRVSSWRELKQWHPDFSLENDVPDLPQTELPNVESNIAKPDKERIRWLLGKAAGNSSKESANPTTEEQSASAPEPPLEQQTKRKEAPVTKVSALLERIRAKERQKKEEIMKGVGPKKIAERAMLSRLPSLADSISFIFYSQRKSIISFTYLCDKLSQSGQVPLSIDECETHVTKIASLVPEWCSIETLGNTKMIRLTRIKSVRQVKQQLEEQIAKSL